MSVYTRHHAMYSYWAGRRVQGTALRSGCWRCEQDPEPAPNVGPDLLRRGREWTWERRFHSSTLETRSVQHCDTTEFKIHSETQGQIGDTWSHCRRLFQHVFGNSVTGGGSSSLIFSLEMRLCYITVSPQEMSFWIYGCWTRNSWRDAF